MPLAPPAGENAARLPRFCLAAAFVLTLLWGALYIGHGNAGLIDEPGQLEAMRHFAERRPGPPAALPNLPGYHFLVLLLTDNQPTLQSARLVTLGCALLALAAFAGAWRQLHGRHPGGATLLLATLPVLQPFTAMAYTDVPALMFLFAGCWAHFARRHALAALLLALACLIRQTNLIWATYLVCIDGLNLLRPKSPTPAPHWRSALWAWIEHDRWLLLLLATGTGIILYAGRLTLGTEHGNQLQPNLATIHFAGVMMFLLGLPYWIAKTPALLRSYRTALTTRPYLVPGLTALGLLVAAVLTATYANPHLWNRELFFPDPPSTKILIRNWPLVWIDRHFLLRGLSGLLIVGSLAGLGWIFARQRYGRELWLLLPFGAVLLLTNGLVEPRYLIPPCALGLMWLDGGSSGPRLAAWFTLLCLIQAPFALLGLALW